MPAEHRREVEGGGLIDVGDGKQIAVRLGPGGRVLGGRGQATPTRPPYVQFLATPLARSAESINADSLNSNFLQLGRRSGGRPQRAVHPMWLPVNTVIQTTLVGLEPSTFRSLVDCWLDALPVVPPTHHKLEMIHCSGQVIAI